MARNNPISKAVYKRHIRLFRYLNDTWIFTKLMRPELKIRAETLAASKSKAKRRYTVPKKGKTVESRRRDSDIAQIYQAQFDRGIFETNIVAMVSRVEAFIQECLVVVICHHPKKLSIIGDKAGIPLDLFLEHEGRDELLERYVALRCEGLMFGKPVEYLDKVEKVLSIQIDDDLKKDYIEIKASRDIIVHNLGEINRLYVDKAGEKARGSAGDELVVNGAYFRHVLITAKTLSGAIQRQVEKAYK